MNRKAKRQIKAGQTELFTDGDSGDGVSIWDVVEMISTDRDVTVQDATLDYVSIDTVGAPNCGVLAIALDGGAEPVFVWSPEDRARTAENSAAWDRYTEHAREITASRGKKGSRDEQVGG